MAWGGPGVMRPVQLLAQTDFLGNRHTDLAGEKIVVDEPNLTRASEHGDGQAS